MDAPNNLEFAVAFFAIEGDPDGRYIVVCLDEDTNERGAADAVARGYSFAGSIAVANGAASVRIEPGFEGAVALAGVRFAELLGPRLKQYQLGRVTHGR